MYQTLGIQPRMRHITGKTNKYVILIKGNTITGTILGAMRTWTGDLIKSRSPGRLLGEVEFNSYIKAG